MVYCPHEADGLRQEQNSYPPLSYNAAGRSRNTARIAARYAVGRFPRTYIPHAPAAGRGFRLKAGGTSWREGTPLLGSGGFLPPNLPPSPAPLRATALRTRKAVADRRSSPDKCAFGATNFLSAADKYAFGAPNFLSETDKYEFGATNSLPATDKYEFGATNSFPVTDKYAFGVTNSLSALDKYKFGAQDAFSAFNKCEFGARDGYAGFPERVKTNPETTAAYAAAKQYGKGAFL